MNLVDSSGWLEYFADRPNAMEHPTNPEREERPRCRAICWETKLLERSIPGVEDCSARVK